MLCDNLLSQSIFFEYPVHTITKNYVHGMGVHPYLESVKDSATARSCDNSIVSLRSNDFLSVYVEIFNKNNILFHEFPQLAIERERINVDSLNMVETLVLNDEVYCFTDVPNKSISLNIQSPPIDTLLKSPVNIGGVWFSFGSAPIFIHNKQASWLRAKNDAAKQLAKQITTSVRILEVNSSNPNSLTYLKSNVIFKNIVVHKRFIYESHYGVVIAVPEADITYN